MPAVEFDIPKEVYDKFDEFLGLLIELDQIRDDIYYPMRQRISASLEMMDENKGFAYQDDVVQVRVSLRFDEEDRHKVLDRSISFLWCDNLPLAVNRAIEILDGFCKELIAAKEPEPEVLIVTERPGYGDRREKTYKISKEWMNWFRRALPHWPPESPFEMGAIHAAKKYFQKFPEDRIERVPDRFLCTMSYGKFDQDLDIEFYRVAREKL